jgi:hypothetical protein
VTCDRSVVFSGYSVSSTNKSDRHNITEILFEVALNTISHKPIIIIMADSFEIYNCMFSLRRPHNAGDNIRSIGNHSWLYMEGFTFPDIHSWLYMEGFTFPDIHSWLYMEGFTFRDIHSCLYMEGFTFRDIFPVFLSLVFCIRIVA